jgi:alpha-tubulin suppressor-like RCC1 family protein
LQERHHRPITAREFIHHQDAKARRKSDAGLRQLIEWQKPKRGWTGFRCRIIVTAMKTPAALILALGLLLTAIIEAHAVILDGTVMVWGANSSGQTNIPIGLSNVTAIAAGTGHTVALKTNGTVVAWGMGTTTTEVSGEFGQSIVPTGLSGVTAIATRSYHTVALKADGTVVAWGAGSINTGSYPDYGQSIIPTGLSNVVMVAAGGYHTVVLRSDSTVMSWGWNGDGQTTIPAGLSNVTAIAAGASHTVALKSDGTVVGWGKNDYGQRSIPAGLSGVMAITAGQNYTMVLESNGLVVAWGDNSFGQTNIPAGLSNVMTIAGGGSHCVALKANGTVVAWGDNSHNQTNVPAGLINVMSIAAGYEHTAALVVQLGISSQPKSVTVNATSNATFNVVAAGAETLSYQWRKDGIILSDATNTTLILNNVQTNQAGNYTVIITNRLDSVTSSVAVLTVNRLTQSVNFSSLLGKRVDDVPFTLNATANSGLSVSYTNSNTAVATVSGNIVTITGIGSTTITAIQDGNSVYLPATNVSQTLTVAGIPPSITNQPASVIINATSNVTFSVTAAGTPSPAYNWRTNGTAISGATNASLTLNNVQTNQAGNYTVVITNGWGSVTSSVATLTVNRLAQTIAFGSLSPRRVDATPFTLTATANSGLSVNYTSSSTSVATVSGSTVTIAGIGSTTITAIQSGNAIYQPATNVVQTLTVVGIPPTITNQPTNITVNTTSNATFSVAAAGTSPLVYRWYQDGVAVSGGTSTSLALGNVQTNQAGNYTVVITNGWGSVTSSVATLTVNRLAQTITFGSLAPRRVDTGGVLVLNATVSSGLTISYTSSDTNVATVSGRFVSVKNIGSTIITASQAGNSIYLPATSVGQTLNVTGIPPSITNQPASVTVNVTSNTVFALSAIGTTPLIYQWRKDDVDINGATNILLTLNNVQTNQVGNYTVVVTNVWGSITSSVAVLSVNWQPQTISFSSLPKKWFDDVSFVLTATASSGLPVSYASSSPSVATVNGNLVTFTGVGSTIITASQSGGATYLPAADVGQTLLVGRRLGSVVAWGYNFSGQTNTPAAGLNSVTAIAAGYSHTVALRTNGTVVAWGDNGNGQTNIPVGLSGVTAIAAGGYHTVALKSNGTVVAWGNNGYGQTNVPVGLIGVRAVAAGYYHTLALKTNGTVVAWGRNTEGQTNVPSGLSGVTAIAAGYYHTMSLQSDGTVMVWGRTNENQTTVPAGLNGVTAIAAGGYHTLALKGSGSVVTWGDNSFGQTNVPVSVLSGVTSIAGGGYHTVVLKNDGSIVAWGNNDNGQTNVPADLSGVTAIAGGGYHTVALITAESTSIVQQPANLTVNVTSNAIFSVSAGGTAPLFFQWVKNGTNVSEATNATLSFIATNRSLAGIYNVRVSNIAGSMTSSNATLRVLVPQRMETPHRLGNGRVQLTFRDQDGSGGVPDDFSKLILLSTDGLGATNMIWVTNAAGFTTTNGYIFIEDVSATNTAQRYYRVVEQ